MARRPAPLVAAALVALLGAASPLLAYTIYLKDGSTLIAREKYKVQGTRAVFTLESGTETFLQLAQIDQAKTEAANKSDYGTAMVVEGGKVQEMGAAQAPPPQQKTLTDFLAKRELRVPPEVRRAETAKPGSVGKTRAGYDDLFAYDRQDYPDLEVGTGLKALYRAQGLDEAQIFRGTVAGRALVEIPANSEASTFQAIEVSAKVLLEARKTNPSIEALELVMLTDSRGRAGQFVMTPADAEALASKQVETTAYFVKNVQF